MCSKCASLAGRWGVLSAVLCTLRAAETKIIITTYRFHFVPSRCVCFFFYFRLRIVQSFTCRNDNANKNQMVVVFAISIRFILFGFFISFSIFWFDSMVFSLLLLIRAVICVVEIEIMCHWTRNIQSFGVSIRRNILYWKWAIRRKNPPKRRASHKTYAS